MKSIVPIERIERVILLIRGQKVILDADLAKLYGVSTKRLNEQVKRNARRFPEDFMFQLTTKEWADLTSQFARSNERSSRSQFATGSQRHRDPRFSPYAFTEHGAIMAAMVLNSPRAVTMSVQVVRAFVRLREMLVSNKELARKLTEVERKVASHDEHIQSLFEAIRRLMAPPKTERRKIGFYAGERGVRYGRSRKNSKELGYGG